MPLSYHVIGPAVKPLARPWPRWAIMASGPGVFMAVKGLLPKGRPGPALWGGLVKIWQTPDISLIGPVLGGGQALMALEFLKAAGVGDFLFIGSAGALKVETRPEELSLNDIFLPTAFLGPGRAELEPYPAVENLAAPSHSPFLIPYLPGALAGPIWSRLTPFRETKGLVAKRQHNGALAVDLECAYLASGSAFLGLNWAPVILISDELGPERWRPSRRDPKFKKALSKAAATAVHYIKNDLMDNRPTLKP